MICSSLNRLLFISVSFRRSPVQTEGASGGNVTAHKKDKVRAWLARHPRWKFHFTSTSCSSLSAVERFFAKLTRRRLKHGVFHSLVNLQAAINRFVAEHNAGKTKPFVWRADPDTIIPAQNRLPNSGINPIALFWQIVAVGDSLARISMIHRGLASEEYPPWMRTGGRISIAG